jgi:hypothetical protein
MGLSGNLSPSGTMAVSHYCGCDDCLLTISALRRQIAEAKKALEETERVLIRIEDVQHGGKDDANLLVDVDTLRRRVTLILRPPTVQQLLEGE